ncbi:MAG: 50S ribosomal protein L23 [Segetibacter sp.]
MSELVIIPVTSEKAYASAQDNVYVFTAPLQTSKQQIVSAIESHYAVSVIGIKSLIQKGKTVAFSRGKKARPGSTTRKDIKKVYATLAEGDTIKIFDEPEEAKDSKDKASKDKPAPKKETK